jgi:hypothetical protein
MAHAHQTVIRSAATSKQRWSGRIISALPILFLAFDAVIHIAKIPPVVEAFARLGYPLSLSSGIGVLALICTAVYAIPRTAVLGAVLLTGYLGGAIATQVRVGAGVFPVVFPIIVAALVWTGLFLRDSRLREFLPLRGEARV